MKQRIEYERYEGVHPLRLNESIPEFLNTQLRQHINKISILENIPDIVNMFGVKEKINIPIKRVYTNTVYHNYFRDFGIDTQSGVYIFKRDNLMLYIGKSDWLGNRLRGHIINYQKDGVNSKSPFVGYSNIVQILTTDNYSEMEKYMIRMFIPIWNKARPLNY